MQEREPNQSERRRVVDRRTGKLACRVDDQRSEVEIKLRRGYVYVPLADLLDSAPETR